MIPAMTHRKIQMGMFSLLEVSMHDDTQSPQKPPGDTDPTQLALMLVIVTHPHHCIHTIGRGGL